MNETEFKILLNEKLCDLIDAILYYYNPCQIKDNSCLLVNDMRNDKRQCCYRSHFASRTEDKYCPFLKSDGCSFRNANCKIWLCETAIKNADPKCLESLKNLENISKIYTLGRGPYLREHCVGKNKEISSLNDVK